MAEEPTTMPAAPRTRSKATIPDRFANPEEAIENARPVNETPWALCALVAALAFAVTLLLLWIDYSQLSAA